MYDEKMIEDSLAFAEEIRARLEGKKTGESSSRPVQSGQGYSEKISQPLSSNRVNVQPADSVSVHKTSSQAQPVSHNKPFSGAAGSQSRPVQKSMSGQTAGTQQSTGQMGVRQNISPQGAVGQPVRVQQMPSGSAAAVSGRNQKQIQQSSMGQAVAAPVQGQSRPAQQNVSGQPAAPAQGQRRPVQQNMSGQSAAVQQTGRQENRQNISPQGTVGQPVRAQQMPSGNTAAVPSRSQMQVQQSTAGKSVAAPVQGQSRPAPQNASGQTTAPAQGQSRPVQKSMSGQTAGMQQFTGQMGVRQNVSSQGTAGQPVRTQQMPSGSAASASGRSQMQVQQSAAGKSVAAPVQNQSRPAPQNVSGQPVTAPAQGQKRPVAQNAAGQAVTAAPVQGQSRPVAQSVSGQASSTAFASTPQSVLPEGQITRQSMPDQTPIPSAQAKTEDGSQQPELKQAEVPKPEQPKKEHLISVSTSTSRPVRPKPSALETVSEETKSMDEPQDENHTVEITIKLDVAGIKKKFSDLKKKLAPEERTLEEVNAAMEENRQLQAEKQLEQDETAAQKGAKLAHKAASTASGIGKKVTGLLRKKQETASAIEGEAVTAEGELIDPVEGEAVDGQIVQLEGEAVEENRFAEKIQDLKEAIPQKAGKASHLVTNIVIIAFCIGIAYFLASFVTNYVAYQTPVEGESMEPTLTDGDSVVIQRLSYYFTDPKRYDVVVFPVNYDSGSKDKTYYIKRVIGLPGETVQIIDGSVYINNEKLTDDKYSSTTINEAGIAENPLVLGENQYFVMGDNRNMSTDSRNSYVGLVNKNDIVGEAWICTWPLNHFGGLK